MSSNQQVPNRSCNCQERIDQGQTGDSFRCITCNQQHLLECFESIHESVEDLVYIESECRSCIIELFRQAAAEVQRLSPQYLITGTPPTPQSETEADQPAPGPSVSAPVVADNPPSTVELQKCEQCGREIWYLSEAEWEQCRGIFPEEIDKALCSDCEEEPTDQEKEELLRDMHSL